jgi:cellulose 1,4-beta-cellobiosidase
VSIQANSVGWEPSDNDVNAGSGNYGSCCPEMDLWEANFNAAVSKSQFFLRRLSKRFNGRLTHRIHALLMAKLAVPAQTVETMQAVNATTASVIRMDVISTRIAWVIQNSWARVRVWTPKENSPLLRSEFFAAFYILWSSNERVSRFITDNGTENGQLSEIRRLYVQDGKLIQNSASKVDGVTGNSISDRSSCIILSHSWL